MRKVVWKDNAATVEYGDIATAKSYKGKETQALKLVVNKLAV